MNQEWDWCDMEWKILIYKKKQLSLLFENATILERKTMMGDGGGPKKQQQQPHIRIQWFDFLGKNFFFFALKYI